MPQGFVRGLIILWHDSTVVSGCFLLAFFLHDQTILAAAQRGVLVFLVPAVIATAGLTFYLCGLHRRVWSYTSTSDCVAIAKASSWLTGVLIALVLALDLLAVVPRTVLPIHWFMSIVVLCASRLTYQFIRASRLTREIALAPRTETPVLVYGCGPIAALYLHAVKSTPRSRLRVVGVVDPNGDRTGRYLGHVPVLGRARDLDRILIDLAVHGAKPRRVVVASDRLDLDDAARAWLGSVCARHGLQIDFLHDALGIRAPQVPPPPVPVDLPGSYERLRRFTDILGSVIALVVFSPLLALVALAVLLDLGPPLLFHQSRPGRHMRPFVLYKFRTMRPPYGDDGTLLSDQARTSRLGAFLRRTRLDELPQFYNVLIGDMSFIGPRPLLPQDLPQDRAERAAMRPGITGWAQVNGGHLLAASDKLALELWYVRNASLGLDARIVWRTLATMLFGERVDHAALVRARAAAGLARSDSNGCEGASFTSFPAVDAVENHNRARLLVVNRYFHPDCSATAQLLTDLVEALDRRGCAIRVFTGRQQYDDPDAVLPGTGTFGGASVLRLRTSRFGRTNLLGRTLDYTSFYAGALFALLREARRGDVLLVETDPPLISTVGWLVARVRGVRLVNWCQDLFPETAAALGVDFARGRAGQILRWLRNRSLDGAAMNVAVCEGMAERLRAEGVPAERLTIIHNWADGARIRPLAPRRNSLRRKWDLDRRFVLGYSGNLGRVHDARSLVVLLEALKAEPDLVTLFIGAGEGYRELRNIFAERGIANVRFRPYQPRESLGKSLTVPDLHLVTLRPECEGLVMPSKLYGILAAGRPIVFIGNDNGDAARLVRERDAGLVARPEQVSQLAAEIRALRARPERLAHMGVNARRAYEMAFSKEVSIAAWLACLAGLGAPCAAPLRQAEASCLTDAAPEREAVAAE